MPQKGCKKPGVSAALKGRIPPNKGQKTDKPAWNRGLSPSAETIAKNAEAHRGRTPWNKGLRVDDPRVAAAEEKRRVMRQYVIPVGRKETLRRYDEKQRVINPFRRREMRGRSRVRQSGGYFERVDLRAVLERDGWVCGICGGFVSLEDLSFDHIKAISLGGDHTASNLQVCHLGCNSGKSNKERAALRVLREEAG